MIRVGVLRGGTSNEYDTSLQTGAFVLRNLPREKYQPVDIFVDKEGVWHIGGMPVSHDVIHHKVDVIWNALHGFYGEDGKVQQFLENISMPYVGTTPLSSSLTMNRKSANENFVRAGVKIPRGTYVESWGASISESDIHDVVATVAQKFSPPWNVYPISRGHANEPARCATREELFAVLLKMADLQIPVLIEEVVFGKKVGIHVLDGFRGKVGYTLLPYESDAQGRAGLRLRGPQKEYLETQARKIHKNFNLGHYSHIHTILTPRGEFYFTQIDTVPRLHPESSIHLSLAEVGSSFKEFSEYLINTVLS